MGGPQGDPRTGTDSRTFELQLRIHLFTVRGSFSLQSVHPSVQPFGALSTCNWKGIGLQSQQEGWEEGATKFRVVRITIIISRP